MSSSRFPGKVLAPLLGKPLIAHVVDRARTVENIRAVVVATSTDASDDPLALYAATLPATIFRGDLANVALRFQQCLRRHDCDWFVRISGDSPVIEPALIAALVRLASGADVDLVTNVAVRTFPPGQSVEILRTATFLTLDTAAFSRDEQEHVTLHYYRNPGRFRILNVVSADPSLADRRLVVDTIEDLREVERLLAEASPLLSGYAASSRAGGLHGC